jgi:hypothetical protein
MTIEKELEASLLAARLTGSMIGLIKHYNDMDKETKKRILSSILDCHMKFPIKSSDDIIEECIMLYKQLDEVL